MLVPRRLNERHLCHSYLSHRPRFFDTLACQRMAEVQLSGREVLFSFQMVKNRPGSSWSRRRYKRGGQVRGAPFTHNLPDVLN